MNDESRSILASLEDLDGSRSPEWRSQQTQDLLRELGKRARENQSESTTFDEQNLPDLAQDQNDLWHQETYHASTSYHPAGKPVLREFLGDQSWKLDVHVHLVEVFVGEHARLSCTCEAQGGVSIRIGTAWGHNLRD